MRLMVDQTLCEGFAVCIQHLPDVFSLDDWGVAQTQNGGEVPSGSEVFARRAVDGCPVGAITLEQD